MYAQLCKRLSEEAPNYEAKDTLESPCTFRVLLLNKCKVEFENRSAANEAFDHYAGKLSPEDEERKHLAKRKMLGNIKFIGELGKLDILSGNILHLCIQQLLYKKRRNHQNGGSYYNSQDCCEDLECLSQLVRTCGRILDTEKGRQLMDQYFERMLSLVQTPELPLRIKFMLRDVIELRRDKWVPRKATSTEGPMPIHQIRGDEDIRGAYMSRNREPRSSERDNDSWMSNFPLKFRGDMISGLNVSSSSTNIIPTHHEKINFGNNRDHRSGEGNFRGHNNHNQQRGNQGNYNNYNNQSRYNKHNQHNNAHNSNYNNNVSSNNKDVAPRFKKTPYLLPSQGPEEVQMRPAANSLLFKANNIKATPPMPLNSASRSHNNDNPLIQPQSYTKAPPPAPASVMHKEPPLLIKQISLDKPKQPKKDKGPNKEDILKKVSTILAVYHSPVDEENTSETSPIITAVTAYKDLKIPDKFVKDVVLLIFNDSLERNDPARENTVNFVTLLRKESLIPVGAPLEGLRAMCVSMAEREAATPRITALVAGLLARAITGNIANLADVATITENGQYYPLFLLVLQQMHKNIGKAEMFELFNNSKVNLMSVLLEADRTKDRLAAILEDRSLGFLYPLLRVQAELWKQLQVDPNPQQFFKWVKDTYTSSHQDPGFINALMTVLLKYITQETTLPEGAEASAVPSKILQEKEKTRMQRFSPVLKAFLNERTELQLIAIYSLQVYCFSLDYPKGMLLRWFIMLYDFEIIEEEAFLLWKEDVTDAYPGKGNALFQVNSWLMWLIETESTDEEGDD